MYESAVPSISNPSRTGYTFTGWDKTIPSTMPANDMTINAGWRINQYTIHFNTDGGTTIDPITQDYDTVITKPADPTKEGYTFTGWDKEIPSRMPATGMTITALWEINQYTITFVKHNGEENIVITQDYNTDVTAPVNPRRTGYTFDRWDRVVPSKMPAENITIGALWTPNPDTPYTVKHYKQNITDNEYPSTPSDTDNLK